MIYTAPGPFYGSAEHWPRNVPDGVEDAACANHCFKAPVHHDGVTGRQFYSERSGQKTLKQFLAR